MKRTDLLRKLNTIAKAKGWELIEVREGGEHTIYRVGDKQLSVPRHREINEHTANGIIRTADKAGDAPKTEGEDES